jgi:hypothetical protein
MLASIARSPSALVGRRRGSRGPAVFFEVWAASGTPDLVMLEFDPTQIERRATLGLGAVTGYSEVAVLEALRRGPLTISELGARVAMTPAHLRRTILPALSARSWVVQSTDRRWSTPEPLAPVARWIVAVEAKRRDWARALSQADRYRRFANRSVVVMDAAVAADRALARAQADGEVGLAVLARECERLTPLFLPPWRRPRSEFEFTLMGEQALSMQEVGIRSGPVLPVFGRLLVASGPDPRLEIPLPRVAAGG